MKKGFKAASAAIIAMSAITPAAVFAADATETVSAGIYTTSNHYTFQEFRELTRAQKVEVLRDTTGLFVLANAVITQAQASTATTAELYAILEDPEASVDTYIANGVTFGENGHTGYVPDPDPIDLTVESVSAINKTTVEVTFNQEVDAVAAGNFTIEGASVTAATLSEDKKTVTLSVSGLDYSTSYTVVVDGVLIDGNEVDSVSQAFTTPAVTDIWNLEILPGKESLRANGADNTQVTFQLVKKDSGEVDVNADDVVLDLNTTYGTLAQERVTIQNGKATVLLTSEFSNTQLNAKIDAQIIEASGDYTDLIGEVVGTTTIPFVTSTDEPVETLTLVSAESNQADRLTLFFDKEFTLDRLVATNLLGELLYQQVDAEGEVEESGLTAAQVRARGLVAEQIRHQLIENAITITQGVKDFTVKGLKPVSGNAKAVEVILEKDVVLTDNASVTVEVNTTNSLGDTSSSDASFKVTDARKPEATSVNPEGLNTLKVKFSEAIADANFQIDGRFGDDTFEYGFGEFNPLSLVDNRDLATIVLTSDYDEDGIDDAADDNETRAGFFTAGRHTLQISSTQDFAYETDRNNLGSTQNLNFNIDVNEDKPNAIVSVESPEQFRIEFDKRISENVLDLELQVLHDGEYVSIEDEEVAERFPGLPAELLDINRVAGTNEYVVELTEDWTQVYETSDTNLNYYNDKFRIVIAENSVTNATNGEQNDEIILELSNAGSPLSSPDTTSARIESIDRVNDENEFLVTMSEPVKYDDGEEEETLNEDQTALPETSVQFLGTDKDGNTVTINGTVNGYADADGADKVLSVSWNEVDGAGEPVRTPQNVVDEGGSEDWTLVIRSLSDDVGNTVASATKDFTIEESPEGASPFYILEDADGHEVEGQFNDEDEDTITITFSEGVQTSGEFDATNPAQYTLNGENLPNGTSISVSDADANRNNGFEIVEITLPDGTLNDVSNVITVNQDLVSYDGSVLTGDYEIEFVVTAGEVPGAPEEEEPEVPGAPEEEEPEADTASVTVADGSTITTNPDLTVATATITGTTLTVTAVGEGTTTVVTTSDAGEVTYNVVVDAEGNITVTEAL